MDVTEESIETHCDDEKYGSSSSLGSSLSSSQDFRRQMKPPNKKQYEEKMEEIQRKIRSTDDDLKSVGSLEATVAQLRDLRAEKEAMIQRRKKYDNDLRLFNQEIIKKMGVLSRTESNLHYKNEVKIDDAIRKMECQLKTQNFRLSDEKRIVAEIDKLKRSKKVLSEYLVQKKEVDKLRESQRRMRLERENLYRIVTNLNRKEEEIRKSIKEKKEKTEYCKKELDQLHAKKRELFAEFKQSESDYQRHQSERRHRLRKESFKKKEEERKAKEEIWQKEMIEYAAQCTPFEDQLNMCNALISYLQKLNPGQEVDGMLPSPREEKPEATIGSTLGPADSLDDGKFVLLKKSEDSDSVYNVANKPRRRSKKGRKLSVTKPLAHTPQIISQFSSLTLTPPSYLSEVTASIEQLQARKRYYEEQSDVPRPVLGSLGTSFSSSGSFSGSLDSPLRERSSTWGFVPPSIAENQTPSDAGASAESGFHDMSRQASKTESSNSAPDSAPGEQVMDDLISQCMQSAESETSRSSSDTITMEEQLDNGSNVKEDNSSGTCDNSNLNSQGNSDYNSDDQSGANNDSLVLEKKKSGLSLSKEELLRGNNSSFMSPTYDDDFPAIGSHVGGKVNYFSDKVICDANVVKSMPNVVKSDVSVPISDKRDFDKKDTNDASIRNESDKQKKVELTNPGESHESGAELEDKPHCQTGSSESSKNHVRNSTDKTNAQAVSNYDEVTHL
ncbi:hypothetical protein ACF0H5_022394 [Mactra antiquata]